MTRTPTVIDPQGLSASDVAERVAKGQVNDVDTKTSRSVLDIIRANLFTRFNAIVCVLSAVVLVFGEPVDALFGLVMVANIIIGVGQELRAKRTLDGLRVLIAPTVVVRRDGRDAPLPIDQVVIDDVLSLVTGDQVPVDGRVVAAAGCEVDESALTGESKPVPKVVGERVLSGSAVVAGAATVVTTEVGADAWIHQLVKEAKEFVLTHSELRAGVDRILWGVSWLLPPLTLLLFWSQLRDDAPFAEGMVSATAGVVALVPQGLVLLVSMAMAVAVIGLARRSVVVQELPAVEGLARADVICLDKTGTLTTGRTRLERITPLGSTDLTSLQQGIASLARSEVTPTAAMRVIGPEMGTAPDWDVVAVVPFSSARKWSATQFAEEGTWVLGAPEVLLETISEVAGVRTSVDELAATARRVLLVAHSSEPNDLAANVPNLPPGLEAAGLVVLAEELRPDAAATMRFFSDQGVDVKVISGDNADTVAAVARELGLPGADAVLDLRSVETITPEMVEETTIFGRVLPEQKRELVVALQTSGHVVAMTGDGVNDIPALKAADIGIGMDTATSATKAVSQLVLLNGRFDLLPSVVAEGRRVVANMERVSSLFVAKTVYAAIFALVVGVGGFAFPFLPRHLTLIDSLTIGVPAFILSFRAADAACRPGYLSRVLHFAVPAGLGGAFLTLVVYGLARGSLDLSLEESRTLATLTLGGVGFWILHQLIRPLDRLSAALLAALVALFTAVFVWPFTADFYALDKPDQGAVWMALAVLFIGLLSFQVLLAGWRFGHRRRGWEMTFGPVRKRLSEAVSRPEASPRSSDDAKFESEPTEEDPGSR